MITGIHHVALVVRSLDDAVSFYRDVLGLAPGRCETVAEQGVRAALFPLEDGEIELLEPVNPAGGVAKFLEKRGEGPHHLCIATSDIDADLAAAKAAAVPLIDQAPRAGLAGRIAFLHPNASQGMLVELAQPEPAAHHAPRGSGIRARALRTVYVGTKDLSEGLETFVRTYAAQPDEGDEDPRLGGQTRGVRVGSGHLTLVPAASAPGLFAGRAHGLLGVCLSVEDVEAAARHLESRDLGVEVLRHAALPPLVRVDPARTNGMPLLLG